MKILRAGAVPWTAISFVLIISIAYLDACGDPGILLVNGKPLPDGTIVRTESETVLGTTDLKTGTFRIFSKDRLTCDWQRRSDGELHALPREQSQYTAFFGERTTRGALEGVALVVRKLDGKWEFGLKSGTASKDQTEALRAIFPPLFTLDRLYPTSSVRIGDHWPLDTDIVPTVFLLAKFLPADTRMCSGTMTLTSITEQNGEKCAAIGFSARCPLTAQVGKNFEIKGEIIRSLKTFQDLSVTARIELPGDSNQAGLVTATLRQTILAGAQLQNTPSALVQDDTDAMKKKALDFLSKHQADLDAKIEKLDAEKRKLEWPPPIPVYSSADDWAKQYQEAKPITTGEFLARTPSLRLAVFADPGIQKYFSDEEWLGLVRRAVETNGFEVRPDASVKLVVETTVEESRLDYSEENSNGIGSTVVNSFPVGLQFLKLKFVVTAPVLRFGRFHNLAVAPVSQWTCKLLRGNLDKDYLGNNCQDQIKDLIDGFRKPAEPDKDDDGAEKAWLASLWDRKRNSQMYEDYLTASKASGVELERCFCDFPRISAYWFFPHEAAREALNIDSYKAQWVQCLNENHAAESSADYIVFKQDLYSYRLGASVAAETLFGFEGSPYYSNISSARFYQYNVVFPLDNPGEAGVGRPALVRRKALICDKVEGDMCVPRNYGYDLRELNKRTMEEVVKQMRYRH